MRGSLYRGDLEPEPYALYAAYTATACTPDACPASALAVFEGGLRLLAARVVREPGGASVELTWEAASAPGRDVQVAALAYAGGEGDTETLLAQADGPLGTELFPTAWWRAGEVVRETRRFTLGTGEVGASLLVRIGLYDPVSGARFARLDHSSEFVEIFNGP
jgi:hypothetical protein